MINEDEQFEREKLKDFIRNIDNPKNKLWSLEAAQDLKSCYNIDIKVMIGMIDEQIERDNEQLEREKLKDFIRNIDNPVRREISSWSLEAAQDLKKVIEEQIEKEKLKEFISNIDNPSVLMGFKGNEYFDAGYIICYEEE